MRVLAFVGDDPGLKGAGCLLGVVDDPDGERHGDVTYCAVWDHVAREVDDGQVVCPVHFSQVLRMHAVYANIESSHEAMEHGYRVRVERFVIERPNVGGGMRFGNATIVSQGGNYGIILGAALCSSEFTCARVETADPVGGKWYAEVGAVTPKGGDRAAHSIKTATDLCAGWHRSGATVDMGGGKKGLRHDQADAILLAYLGVLRWLGRAHVAPGAGEKARTRSKSKAARDHEVARATEGLRPADLKAKARTLVCPRCDVPEGILCDGKSIHRERIWHVAAKLRREQPMLTLSVGLQKLTGELAPVIGARFTCSRGVWRCSECKVTREQLDEAIDAGLLRLELDEKKRPVWVYQRAT